MKKALQEFVKVEWKYPRKTTVEKITAYLVDLEKEEEKKNEPVVDIANNVVVDVSGN